MNVRWLLEYRWQRLLDIDEAGYIAISLSYHYALLRDGISGWLEAIAAPGIQAPATMALSSLQYLVTGPHVITVFAVSLLAALAVILLTYRFAGYIGGRRLAWIALALVATAPGIIVESRAYHFAITAAAATTAALYFLVRSHGLSRTWPTVAFGAFLGLMVLTRTMTIAFLPPLLLAAVVQAAVGPNRRARFARLGGAVVAAMAVAAPWYVPNGARVFRYLLGFGYGQESAEYGEEAGILNPAAWVSRFHVMLDDQHLPHVALLGAGAVAAIFAAVRAVRRGDFWSTAIRSPLFPTALLVAGGYAALLSSKNIGQHFALPLLPATVVLAVWGLSRFTPRLDRALPVAVALVAFVAAVPMLDLRAPTASVWATGGVKITDGRGVIHEYEGVGLNTDATEPISADTAKEWIAASDWAAKEIINREALRGTTAFGFRGRLFNTNTVQLAMVQTQGYGVAMAMINPTKIGNTEAAYRRWLTVSEQRLSGDASGACLLFTATGTHNEFTPAVDPESMVSVARTTGFTPVSSYALPDGRELTLWHRPQPTC